MRSSSSSPAPNRLVAITARRSTSIIGSSAGASASWVAQPDQLGVELSPDHLALRVVVAEEGAPADPHRGGDLVDRGLVVPLAGEEVERGPGHVLGARCSGAGPGPPRRVAARLAPWRRVRSSGFHFGIQCYKLKPHRPAARPRPADHGGPMTVDHRGQPRPPARRPAATRPADPPAPGRPGPTWSKRTCWSRTSPSTACAASTRPSATSPVPTAPAPDAPRPPRPPAARSTARGPGPRTPRCPSGPSRSAPWPTTSEPAGSPSSRARPWWRWSSRWPTSRPAETPAGPPASPPDELDAYEQALGHPGRVRHDLPDGRHR